MHSMLVSLSVIFSNDQLIEDESTCCISGTGNTGHDAPVQGDVDFTSPPLESH